jgi:hypothetical protein
LDHLISVVQYRLDSSPEDKFIGPDWGYKVEYGMGLSFQPVRLLWLAGRYDNPMPQSTLSPRKGLWIWLLVELKASFLQEKTADQTTKDDFLYSSSIRLILFDKKP